MKAFTMKRGANGEQTFARPAPDHIDVRVLAANTGEFHTVPTGAAYVIFSADGDFFARPNSGAAVPATDVTAGTGSELNPVIWALNGVTSISLIASAPRIVTLTFYKDNSQ